MDVLLLVGAGALGSWMLVNELKSEIKGKQCAYCAGRRACGTFGSSKIVR